MSPVQPVRPVSQESKAICVPSGDQSAEELACPQGVSCCRSLPSVRTLKRPCLQPRALKGCRPFSFGWEWQETNRVKTIHCPSGENCGSESPSALAGRVVRSEEHTSELQSHVNIVCRLLLVKKKKTEC